MRETGPVRNKSEGKNPEYYGIARTLLGITKNIMKLGGLDQLTRTFTLKDGVVIRVQSIFGQDSIEVRKPVVNLQRRDLKETGEEKTNPYLWIGARIMYEKMSAAHKLPYAQFGLVVAEPGQNGIVASSYMDWAGLDVGTNASMYRNNGSSYTPFKIETQQTKWAINAPWVPSNRHHYIINNRPVSGSGSWGDMRFTNGLLRSYDIYGSAVYNPGAEDGALLPFDPRGKDEDLLARVFPADYTSYGFVKTLWDQVVVLDPDEGGRAPTSRREEDKVVREFIRDKAGVSADVMNGEYVIKLVAVAEDCNWTTSPSPYTLGWNEELTNYFDPLPIEVEVRVGKEPHTVTQRYQVEIPRYSELRKNIWPFGDFGQPTGADCGKHNSVNHHMANWWQGAIFADVAGNAITKMDRYIPDFFGNEEEEIGNWVCGRTKWDIYVQIFPPQCFYAEGSYSVEAARLAYGLQAENARRGWYGQLSIPYRTQADVEAAAALVINDDTGEGLYRYQVETNIFTPVSSDVSDPNPTHTTDFPWEDYYRVYSLQHGLGFAKAKFGYGSPTYDGYQYAGDPPFDYCVPLV